MTADLAQNNYNLAGDVGFVVSAQPNGHRPTLSLNCVSHKCVTSTTIKRSCLVSGQRKREYTAFTRYAFAFYPYLPTELGNDSPYNR